MNYAERAYFDGDHCAHVAAWQDQQRIERNRRITARYLMSGSVK